jgi:3-deoxy-D-manno-octulosonic-acid transferase
MRHLYTILMFLLLPVYVFHLLWRGLRNHAYWRRWFERFGSYPVAPREAVIWIHAVSVGEVQASLPLIHKLQEHYPEHGILVTTTTPTGSSRVRESLGEDVLHVYAPYDLPFTVNSFLNHFRPALAVVMETEIWPNLYYQCERRQIPLLLANARLSERSAQGYRKLHRLTRATLQRIRWIAAQTRDDAERLIQLGADADRVSITGSVKVDVKVAASLFEQAAVLRREWGNDRTVWIAASTHEGEETQLLDIYEQLVVTAPELLLVLVPRHPERFGRVASLCQKRKLETVLRSEGEPCSPGTQVFIGDSMGELPLFYAAADIAFVGGSLIPHGGQNLIEAAAMGKPVIVGPYMFNFEEITRMMVEAGAVVQVNDSRQLAVTMQQWLQDPELRNGVGEKGLEVVERNRGAVDRLQEIIRRVMTERLAATAASR